jgi:hypothetical protein
MTVTNQSFFHEKIKNKLNMLNSFYHAVQKLLFSLLVSKSVEMKM